VMPNFSVAGQNKLVTCKRRCMNYRRKRRLKINVRIRFTVYVYHSSVTHCTWFSVCMRPLTELQAVAVSAVSQRLGLLEIWGCHSDADIDSSFEGYDSWYE
jgi:hypothetical protein